jgi:hypothetical protein
VTPDEAPAGSEVVIRCAARPALRVSRITLHHRGPGSEDYTAVTMTSTRKGWHRAAVPTQPGHSSFQYFVEAESAGGKTAATQGEPQSPELVLLRRAGGAPTTRRDDRPEEPLELRQEELDRAEAALLRPELPRFWIGLGLGVAQGVQFERDLEFRSDLKAGAGLTGAGLPHLMPEVGYQWNERYAIAVQTRHQWIPERGSGDGRPGGPRTSAHAVLVRGLRFLGEGRTQLFGAAALGGGPGFRLVVPPSASQGLARNDTIRGGPILLGGGGGVLHHFGPRFGLALELRVLAGVPDFALLGELNLGLQASF